MIDIIENALRLCHHEMFLGILGLCERRGLCNSQIIVSFMQYILKIMFIQHECGFFHGSRSPTNVPFMKPMHPQNCGLGERILLGHTISL